MKITIFVIFDPTWTHILAPKKAQIWNCLNSILVKKDRNYIIINFVTLRLTKVKLLNIISFLPFLTQIGQKIGPNILKIWYF